MQNITAILSKIKKDQNSIYNNKYLNLYYTRKKRYTEQRNEPPYIQCVSAGVCLKLENSTLDVE